MAGEAGGGGAVAPADTSARGARYVTVSAGASLDVACRRASDFTSDANVACASLAVGAPEAIPHSCGD